MGVVGVRHDHRKLGGELGIAHAAVLARLDGVVDVGEFHRPVRGLRVRNLSIDLVEFHRSKGVFYLAAFFVLGLLAIAFNVTFGLEHYYSQWVRDTLLTLPLLALLVVAIFIRVGWVQMACAAIQGVLSTYFLIVAINIAP